MCAATDLSLGPESVSVLIPCEDPCELSLCTAMVSIGVGASAPTILESEDCHIDSCPSFHGMVPSIDVTTA